MAASAHYQQVLGRFMGLKAQIAMDRSARKDEILYHLPKHFSESEISELKTNLAIPVDYKLENYRD